MPFIYSELTHSVSVLGELTKGWKIPTHTHTLTNSHTHTHTHTFSLSPSHTHTHSHSLTAGRKITVRGFYTGGAGYLIGLVLTQYKPSTNPVQTQY